MHTMQFNGASPKHSNVGPDMPRQKPSVAIHLSQLGVGVLPRQRNMQNEMLRMQQSAVTCGF